MEKEWFENPSWWFNCPPEIDDYLTLKYGHLIENCDKSSALEKILVYDQLVRHVYRKEQAAHIICYFLQKALTISINLDELNDDQFCFALLPLRHSRIINNIYKCIRLSWERIQKCDSLQMRKFLKASYERAELVGAAISAPCKKFNDSILFHNPMQNFKSPSKFVELPYLQDKVIVVSLSGGVDSMVSSLLMKHAYARNNKVIALHINYDNRTSADEEERFVRHWCSRLGLTCYVRKLHEIKRNLCMQFGLRDLYETYTRNVRYFCYKMFGKDAIVVLGHNKDDIMENIFTNIAGKTKYENLDGMVPWSMQDNILFWRPLLEKKKMDIAIFAHEHNVPYLPTSTPVWSMRGQIRASVVPVLNKWNADFVPALHDLSDNMKELYDFMREQVQEVLKTMIIDEKGNKRFRIKKHASIIFWRSFFLELRILPSVASLKNMCLRLERWEDGNKIKIMLCKDVMLELGRNYLVILQQPQNVIADGSKT